MRRAIMFWVGSALAAVFPIAIATSGWETASKSGAVAICFRIGVLCLATAFAWPQVEKLWRRIPNYILAVVGGLLLVVAVRPKLIGIAAALAAIALAVHVTLRFFSQRPGQPK